MESIIEGRIVHFVLVAENGEFERICRPAIIVNSNGRDATGVNLQIFLDGFNDRGIVEDLIKTYPQYSDTEYDEKSLTLWRTMVRFSEEKEIGTWHWPKRT